MLQLHPNWLTRDGIPTNATCVSVIIFIQPNDNDVIHDNVPSNVLSFVVCACVCVRV